MESMIIAITEALRELGLDAYHLIEDTYSSYPYEIVVYDSTTGIDYYMRLYYDIVWLYCPIFGRQERVASQFELADPNIFQKIKSSIESNISHHNTQWSRSTKCSHVNSI